MSKCVKRVVHWLSVLSFCAVAIAQPLSAGSPPKERVFQNQLVSLGEQPTAIILHAQQMGYDYINGQPWSATRAREGTASGLGVLYNTGADSAKWMRFNPELTTINGRPITSTDQANFDKALCMKNPNATLLTDRFKRDTQYPNTILFHPNYFNSEAIDILVAYNIELFEQHGGAATHAGVYMDQINAGTYSPYPGPCLNPGPKNFATATDGQLEYIKRMQHYFRDQLGLPMSGNPWLMKNYQSRHSTAPFDFYYNENASPTTNHVSQFGVIPPEYVAVSLADHLVNDYLQALSSAGIAMAQGSWFGWFPRANPSQTVNGVQLLRALPNWDNLVNVTERFWNPDALVYQTSNSYADPNVVYGRHPKTGKLFVVFQSPQGVLSLRPGEVVTDVKRVDGLFIETTDGRADLAIAGSRVTLANTTQTGKGYIFTTATATNRPPIADAGRNQTVTTGAVVQLDGTGSQDADGDLLTYSWQITTAPSGSTATLSAPKAVKPSFVADQVGQYVVSLQVNDGKATSAPAVVTITAIRPNSPPVADAGREQTVLTGAVVQLDGTGSKDADGDPLTHSWQMTTIPPGSQATLSAPQTPQPSFVADQVGQYVVSLQVNDGKATSAPAVVTITAIRPNSPPVAQPQTLSTPVTKAVGTVLTGSDPDGDSLTFHILTPPVNGTLSGLPPQVTYTPKPGFSGEDHFVFCTNDGQADSPAATVSIQVTPAPPAPINLVLNPSFEQSPAFSSWHAPKSNKRVNSTLSIESAQHGTVSAQVNVKKAGRAADVELRQVVSLSPKGVYRLRFWAKASSNRPFTTLLMQYKRPWGTVGLWQQVSLSSHWQQFDIIFTYTGVEPKARLVFRMGDQSGTVWIDNVELIAQP